MKRLIAGLALGLMVIFSTASIAEAKKEDKPQALPNGASSLAETYGLWTVNCVVQGGARACGMGRQEVNGQNQPIVSLSLTSAHDGAISGLLVVPFGVLVSKPIELKIDDSKTTQETHVRTCLAQGCLVPVSFDKAMLASLRSGKKLKLSATSAGNGEPVINNLFIQLGGFGSALDRLASLTK